MKLLVLIMAVMSISSSFAEESIGSSASEFTDTISVNKTSVDMRVRQRGWITEGSIHPELNLVSFNSISFEYQFNPFSQNEVEGIFSDLLKESLLVCRRMGKEELATIKVTYPSHKYETVLNIKHFVKFKNLDEYDFGLSAFLETECFLELRLREKR